MAQTASWYAPLSGRAEFMSDNGSRTNYTISDLAEEFHISTRTIRFYEEKSLISPGRTKGNHRIYSRRDRARLRLILRGKRFGYTLEEIAETRGDTQEAIDMTYSMAVEGRRSFGQTTPSEMLNKFCMSVRQPLGVCGMITP